MSAQSWFDLITQSPQDPRGLIVNPTFANQAGASQAGTFMRSTNWLQAATWVSPVVKVTPAPTIPANIFASNPQDFASIEAANLWNSTHMMTSNNPQLPQVAEGLIFLKSGANFINNIFLDFTGGATSTSVQLSYRDNSYTAGDFTAGATGTIPVFDFGSTTFGGTNKQLSLTLLTSGRFHMGLRVVDNGGNYSLFPMEWVVL